MMATFGPNVDTFDHVPPIREDPLFTSWTKPIPPQWYSQHTQSYTIVDQEALYASLLYSRTYGRVGAETVATPTDAATKGVMNFVRFGVEGVSAPGDGVTTTKTLHVAGSEATTVTDRGQAWISSGALIKRPIDDFI